MVDIEKILQNPHQVLQNIKEINLDNALIYLAGSLMEGFGNETSDIDVYIVCDQIPVELLQGGYSVSGEVVIIRQKNVVHSIVKDGIRYGYEYWSWKDFNQIISYINGIDFNSTNRMKRINDDEFDVLHRIKYGKPLINEERYTTVYNSILFDNLNFYYAIFQSQNYMSFVEDIQGAYISKDLGSAFFMTRRLIDITVTSYLAAHGETNPNIKWLYRKIVRYQKNTGDEELLKGYIYFQTHPFEDRLVEGYIKEAMRFCQKLNIQIQSLVKAKQLTNC